MNLKKMQSANIEYDERGVPIATRFDDPYFSFSHGLEEAQYVFLDGNSLSSRLSSGFQIGEIGFGTGLNFFAVWQLWKALNQTGTIHFTSFEAFPMTKKDRLKSLKPFVEITDLVNAFSARFDGTRFEADGITLRVVAGDVNTTLKAQHQFYDAWFLDGFSPQKNPDAWGESLLLDVGKHTKHQGTAATYSAAGHVRKKLTNAGFTVSRTKGYGGKRHMTTAVMDRP